MAGHPWEMDPVRAAGVLNFVAFVTGIIALAIGVSEWEKMKITVVTPKLSYEIGFYIWCVTLVLHLVLGFISQGGSINVGQMAAPVPAAIN
jgi:hypothetical protein